MSEQSSVVEVYQLHVWLCEILPLFGAGDEAEAVGTPLESHYPINDGHQRLQIQGEPWDDHDSVVCSAHEFHWSQIDDKFANCILLTVPKRHRDRRTVGFHIAHHDVNQGVYPCWRGLCHAGVLLRTRGDQSGSHIHIVFL